MSHVVPNTAAPARLHPRRAQVVTLFVLLVMAAGIATLLIAQNGDSRTSAVPRIVPTQTSGPNEAARGRAAATAAGVTASPGSGGPNEALRGQAAQSATR